MKKFLLVILGFVIILFLVSYFSNKSKSQIKRQLTTEPTIYITQTESRSIIGIHYRLIDKQTALANKLVEGAYITQVIAGSSAEEAKLQEEDIIIEIDGRSISGLDEQSIYNLISTLRPKSKVNLKVWRDQEILNIQVTLN